MDQNSGMSGKRIIQEIIHIVENEYYSRLSLSDMASRYFINPSYLSSLFLAETGINFSEFVRNTKLQKAKEFLEFTDLSSEQVAELTGFCDRTYFSGVFTKNIGISPSIYRKKTHSIKKSYEEYVYISLFKNDPMIISQDLRGLKFFADECHVSAFIEAPEVYEADPLRSILERVIERKPAGLMICAVDNVCIPYINQAIRAGIPTITVDCDCLESERLATITSDWDEVGRLQAFHLAKAIGCRGKVAVLFMKGPNNVNKAVKSFEQEIARYPEIDIIGFYDDVSDRKRSETIGYEVLERYPSLAGVAGFDSNSVPGFCTALVKQGLANKVKVTSIDVSPILIDLLQNGVVDTLIGQKRELFTYWGGKLLYAVNHSGLAIAPHIKGLNISNAPCSINTGVFVLKREDIK